MKTLLFTSAILGLFTACNMDADNLGSPEPNYGRETVGPANPSDTAAYNTSRPDNTDVQHNTGTDTMGMQNDSIKR